MGSTSNFSGMNIQADVSGIEAERAKMCERWTKTDKVFETCDIQIRQNENGCVVFEGQTKDPLRSRLIALPNTVFVQYWAASPPDYRTSFSGSGFPFPNEETAFDRSPNIGKVPLSEDGSFKIKLRYPNSYYKRLGSVYVRPSVKLIFRDIEGNMLGKVVTIVLGEGIPFRSLTWPRNRNWSLGPFFYCGRENLPIRTQAVILKDSGYPCVNREPPNFWGLRPPLPEG
jgi:hypothetical protein